MERIRRHIWISGLVQGVSFRALTQREALRRGIAGWVRNLPDGRVEAVLEGRPADVAALVAWCHHGPPYARVEQVEVRDEPAAGDLAGFTVRR